MDDSESIEDIADRLKTDATAQEREFRAEVERDAQLVGDCLRQVRESLYSLQESPAGRIRIYLRTVTNAAGQPVEVQVRVSVLPPWRREAA